MKKIFFLLPLLFIFLSLSCQKNEINIVCLVDFSNSIPKSTLEGYKVTINNEILKNLSFTDKLIVLPIDYGSETSSLEIFMADMGSYKYKDDYDSPLQEDELKQRRIKVILDSLSKKLDESFSLATDTREKYNKGTDIIGGLKQTEKYFEEKSNNIVFVFSDMIQETDNLNLVGLKDNKDIDKLLTKAPVTDIKNLDAFIFTGEQPDVQISLYNNLKTFWTKYLDKCNIKLVEYNSGGTSIISSKLKKYHEKGKIF